MAIRLSGLTSGLDTDAIVQELVSAYSLKTEKYEKAQTKLEWKQDIWKSLNTKIYSLYTNVSNLRYSSAYSLRKTSVSDNTKASVTASSDAVTGTQKLNIINMAQAGYMTGGQLKSGITADSKLSDLGYTGENGTIEVKKNDGTTEQIKVSKNTSISDFLNSLKGAGINASYDANNRRLFLSAKESGAQNDFSLSGTDGNGEEILKALGLDAALVEVDENGNKTFTASAAAYKEAYEKYYLKATDIDGDGVDVEDVKAYINNQITEYENLQKQWNSYNGTYQMTSAENRSLQEELEKLQEKYDGVDIDARKTELSANRTTLEADVTNAQDVVTEKEANVTSAQATVTDLENQIAALDTTADDYDTKLADLEAQLTTATDALTVAQEELTTAQTDLTTAQDALAEVDAELADFARMDEIPGLITANEEKIAEAEQGMTDTKASMEAMDVDEFLAIKNDKNNSEETNLALLDRAIFEMAEKAVKANEILTDATGAYTTGGATKIDGSDAEIRLNGVLYTSATNSFSINGLTIEATGVTGDGETNAISINTSIDTQGIYDKIKDFLTEYNSVINEMTKLYNAESASDYEPLTDEEKEAMSDDQIEKWENKIKDSLLRRDTTLNGVMSAMVNSMAQTIEIDGQKLSLSTFGIGTLGFLNAPENENYAYHIDGDEDDENTSGKKDKLMAAIQENPEQICEFMKKLTSNLYTSIDNKMKSTSLSSAYKVYNDKEMDNQITEYKELISKWEEKVSDREEYYYSKFTQMETALSKLQNQTNSLSGLFSS